LFGQSSIEDINVKHPLKHSLLPCLNSGAKTQLLAFYMHKIKFDIVLLIIFV